MLAVALLITEVLALGQCGDGFQQLFTLGSGDEVLPVTQLRDASAQLTKARLTLAVELAFGAVAQ